MNEVSKVAERPTHILIDPRTGGEIELNPMAVISLADPMELCNWIDQADGDEVAMLLRSVIDWEQEHSSQVKLVMKARLLEVLDRMGGVMTRELGSVKVVGTSAAAAESYRSLDTDKALAAVKKLVKDGLLDKSVIGQVAKREVRVTVSRAAIDRLVKTGGPVAAALEECYVAAPKQRDVSVSWA